MSPGVTAQKTNFRVYIRRTSSLKYVLSFEIKQMSKLLGSSACCNERSAVSALLNMGGWIETIGFTDCNWAQLSAYLTLALETLLFSKVSKWPWGLETNWKIHAEVLGSMQVSVQQQRNGSHPSLSAQQVNGSEDKVVWEEPQEAIVQTLAWNKIICEIRSSSLGL